MESMLKYAGWLEADTSKKPCGLGGWEGEDYKIRTYPFANAGNNKKEWMKYHLEFGRKLSIIKKTGK